MIGITILKITGIILYSICCFGILAGFLTGIKEKNGEIIFEAFVFLIVLAMITGAFLYLQGI